MLPDMNFDFEEYWLRMNVREQFQEQGHVNPPQGMSSEDLAIWRDEARKVKQGVIMKVGERLQ